MQKKWFLWFIYHHPLGIPFLWIFRMSWFSRMMGGIFMTPYSRYLIGLLMRVYDIKLETYQVPHDWFTSVNDFFIRSSRENFRIFPQDARTLWSPVDGCIQVFQNISRADDFSIKWYRANLDQLFWPKISDFVGWDVCFCRLRFSDYHRFHFFDAWKILISESRNGPLYSVDASVLDTGLWVQNKSNCMLFHTQNFGNVLMLEVGATNVWSIIQNKNSGDEFFRWEEKWYFQLWWSAVLLVFQKGIIQWNQKILKESLQWNECEVMAGQEIGVAY